MNIAKRKTKALSLVSQASKDGQAFCGWDLVNESIILMSFNCKLNSNHGHCASEKSFCKLHVKPSFSCNREMVKDGQNEKTL